MLRAPTRFFEINPYLVIHNKLPSSRERTIFDVVDLFISQLEK